MNIRQSAPGDRTLAVGDLGAPDTGPGAQGARAAGGQATLPEAGMAAADVDVANLPRGAIIGRYMVLNRLGAGGMGVVYAAYDPELDRKVAIKLLLGGPGSFGGTQGRARLMREAQAMARVSHPNVISVFDIGTAFGQVFVAMEFVDGGTLTEWLKGKRTQDEILHMFILAGRGLLAAHAAGLVHRGLS
jgi:serine/threonine protein kinase